MNEVVSDLKQDAAIISVVRNWDVYRRCIAENGHLAGCELHPIDNTVSNDFIGVCYNRFIRALDFSKPRWLVFCHEDFEMQEDILPRLRELDKEALWGPVGVVLRRSGFVRSEKTMFGQLIQSDKDGDRAAVVGTTCAEGQVVDTFDCVCVIVHSTLLERNSRLRFDEQLTYDLYVEDFCITAKELCGIPSRIVPLRVHHWSNSSTAPRYYLQEAYLRRKWPHCAYASTCSMILGGDAPWWSWPGLVLGKLKRRAHVFWK